MTSHKLQCTSFHSLTLKLLQIHFMYASQVFLSCALAHELRWNTYDPISQFSFIPQYISPVLIPTFKPSSCPQYYSLYCQQHSFNLVPIPSCNSISNPYFYVHLQYPILDTTSAKKFAPTLCLEYHLYVCKYFSPSSHLTVTIFFARRQWSHCSTCTVSPKIKCTRTGATKSSNRFSNTLGSRTVVTHPLTMSWTL